VKQTLEFPFVVALPASFFPPRPAGTIRQSGYFNRDVLRATLMIQFTTKKDVIDLLGKPSQRQSFGTVGTENWYYNRVTHDPMTDTIDAQVQIVFNGRAHVRYVNFYA
jgi:hypothetical protein